MVELKPTPTWVSITTIKRNYEGKGEMEVLECACGYFLGGMSGNVNIFCPVCMDRVATSEYGGKVVKDNMARAEVFMRDEKLLERG